MFKFAPMIGRNAKKHLFVLGALTGSLVALGLLNR